MTTVEIPLAFLHRNTLPDNSILVWAHVRALTQAGDFWLVDLAALEILTGVPAKACAQTIAWLENRQLLEADRPERGKLYVRAPAPEPHWEQSLANRLDSIEQKRDRKVQNQELRVAAERSGRLKQRGA